MCHGMTDLCSRNYAKENVQTVFVPSNTHETGGNDPWQTYLEAIG